MNIQIIISFLVTMLTITFILFNAPYWEGKKMYDISKNGIWRLLYSVLAKIGYALYQLLELVVHEITLQLIGKLGGTKEERTHPILINTINLIMYCIAMYLLANMYDSICTYIVDGSNGIEYLASGDSIRHEESIFVFMLGTCSFVKVVWNEIIAGNLNVLSILVKVLGLVIWNIFYFSIMYGMLTYKVNEIKFTTFLKLNNKESITGKESLRKQFWIKVKESIYNWLDEKTVLKNLFSRDKEKKERFNLGAFSLFSVLIFICIWILNISGWKTLNIKDFLWEIIDELQLLDILFSFVITFGLALLLKKGVVQVVETLPDRWKEEIEQKSDAAERIVRRIEERRIYWSSKNDNIENAHIKGFYALKPRHRNGNKSTQTSTQKTRTNDTEIKKSQHFQEKVYIPKWGKGR